MGIIGRWFQVQLFFRLIRLFLFFVQKSLRYERMVQEEAGVRGRRVVRFRQFFRYFVYFGGQFFVEWFRGSRALRLQLFYILAFLFWILVFRLIQGQVGQGVIFDGFGVVRQVFQGGGLWLFYFFGLFGWIGVVDSFRRTGRVFLVQVWFSVFRYSQSLG